MECSVECSTGCSTECSIECSMEYSMAYKAYFGCDRSHLYCLLPPPPPTARARTAVLEDGCYWDPRSASRHRDEALPFGGFRSTRPSRRSPSACSEMSKRTLLGLDELFVMSLDLTVIYVH